MLQFQRTEDGEEKSMLPGQIGVDVGAAADGVPGGASVGTPVPGAAQRTKIFFRYGADESIHGSSSAQ
jgi:hypothetical protein